MAIGSAQNSLEGSGTNTPVNVAKTGRRSTSPEEQSRELAASEERNGQNEGNGHEVTIATLAAERSQILMSHEHSSDGDTIQPNSRQSYPQITGRSNSIEERRASHNAAGSTVPLVKAL